MANAFFIISWQVNEKRHQITYKVYQTFSAAYFSLICKHMSSKHTLIHTFLHIVIRTFYILMYFLFPVSLSCLGVIDLCILNMDNASTVV